MHLNLNFYTNTFCEVLVNGGKDKHLKQWRVEDFELEKDYGQIHDDTIKTITVGKSGHFLFTGSYDKHVKCFDLYTQELHKDLGEVHTNRVQTLVVDDQRAPCNMISMQQL